MCKVYEAYTTNNWKENGTYLGINQANSKLLYTSNTWLKQKIKIDYEKQKYSLLSWSSKSVGIFILRLYNTNKTSDSSIFFQNAEAICLHLMSPEKSKINLKLVKCVQLQFVGDNKLLRGSTR